MKNLLTLLVVASITFSCTTLLFAQKGNTHLPTSNLPAALPPSNLPDLVVSSLTKGSVIIATTYENGIAYKSYTISYKAVVKNQGKTATAMPCELGCTVTGIDGCSSIPPLQPGQSVTVEGTFRGKVKAGISDFVYPFVVADMPNCSYEDNPDPSWGEIQEANESNNKSSTIAVSIK